MLDGIAAGLSKLGYALHRHAGPVSTPELTSAEIIISGLGFAVSKSIIASAHRLRGIGSPITGIDGIDVAAATEHGIIVANGQVTENTESMAEATVLLLLAAMYDLHGTETVLRKNLPRPRSMNHPARRAGRKNPTLRPPPPRPWPEIRRPSCAVAWRRRGRWWPARGQAGLRPAAANTLLVPFETPLLGAFLLKR
jgi:lactate dehydrogenase-like 2-hydroxyacid dehydrogenase